MGFDIKKAFATDKVAESEGKKLTLVPAKDGKPESFLLIARKGNPKYKQYITRVLQENQTVLQTKTPEAESLAQGIFKDAAARYLLIGWGGIDWNGAQGVPYAVETAREMLEVDDFNKLVDDYAGDMANYRKEEVEAEAKNS